MWEGFSSRPPISRYCPLWLMPHGFVQSHIGERRLAHVPYKLELKTHVYHYYTMWKGFSSQPPISRYCPLWLMPHEFVQSHIGERRLPHVPYKLKLKTRVPLLQTLPK